MLLIAAHARPNLSVPEWLQRLDGLAGRCDAVDRFDGDRDDYYNPRNSYLPDVVDQTRGIPITLSVLAMEVGRRLRIPVTGVGMPGHFLVGDARHPDRFGDPFNAGAILDRTTCERR